MSYPHAPICVDLPQSWRFAFIARSFSDDISLVDEDFANMRAMGLNMIRLGLMWPAIEPRRGVYNDTFLRELEALTVRASEYGIYTLLDGHQDSFSERFCGAGMPDWAVAHDGSVRKWGAWPSPADWRPIKERYAEPRASPPFAVFPTRQECDAGRFRPQFQSGERVGSCV
jgi:hypothetical protein